MKSLTDTNPPPDLGDRAEAKSQNTYDSTVLRLAAIVQSSDDAIISSDLDGTIVTWNPAAERIFGFTAAEVAGESIAVVISPEMRDEQLQILTRLKNGEHIDHYETVRVTKSGKRLDVSLTLSPLRDATGSIAGVVGIVRELTERKEFEHALRGRSAFEKFLFDLSRTFIGLPEQEVDVNMERGLAQVGEFLRMDRVTILELSPARTELSAVYSWSAPGVSVGASPVITDFAQPWWVSQVVRGKVALASRVDDLPEEAAAEKAYFGERGIASAASIPLKVGGEIAGAISFVTMHRHISWTDDLVDQLRIIGDILWNALRRRQTMQALLAAQAILREREERFRLAMNNVAEGVYTLDTDGMVTYVNPAAETMLGWTNAELLGKKMHDVTHYKHPDGTRYPASECPGLQVLERGTEVREYDDTFIRKDGSLFPVVFSASPLRKDGTTVGIVVGFRDDSLRREAERSVRVTTALRASEDRYRGLAEQVVDGIFVTDAQGRYVDANQAACQLMGYTLEELKTLTVADVLSPEEIPRLSEQFRELGTGQVVRNEWRLRRKDGSVFTGELIARQLGDGRLQGVVRDTSERKEAEDIQRWLHELAMLPLHGNMDEVFAAILETAVTISHGDFGNIQLLDAHTSKLRIVAQRGFPPWWIDYWNATTDGVCMTALERGARVIVGDVEESPLFSAEALEMQRKANVRALQSTPLVTRSGMIIGILSTYFKKRCRPDARSLLFLDLLAREATDIIQYAQTQAELRHLAAMLDLANEAIFVRDREGRITYWNEGAVRCYGWSREEALGKTSNMLLKTQFPESLEQTLDSVQRTGHWDGELVHTCRDGRLLTMASRWALQREANDEASYVLEINQDITERKRLELERAEQTRRKDEFLAFLGHELRNPLAAVDLAIQVLSRGASAPQRARMEDIIQRQTVLMRRLVDDLLELERITHGHIELKLERLDLADCLKRSVTAVQSTVASRHQHLALRLPSRAVSFVADGARIDQIVGNLLTNASKYTSPGGHIELSAAREGSEVIIRCKDDGQGILPEDQLKIFEPFTRGRKTELGFGEASVGLGLALVRQLTELHGGTISLASGGVALGSEFTVRLPIAPPASPHRVVEQPKVRHATHQPRVIVIVEDNPSVSAALQAALEQAGHTVRAFADGPSALAGTSDMKPDAFVIDIGLPGLDGYELAAKLKERSDTQAALRIAISGLTQRDRAGYPDAFDDYFNKPLDVRELLARLDRGRPSMAQNIGA